MPGNGMLPVSEEAIGEDSWLCISIFFSNLLFIIGYNLN